MELFGFSLNALSLFSGWCCNRYRGPMTPSSSSRTSSAHRESLSPLDATRQAMREVTGPIVATALVLCAVLRTHRLHQRTERPVLQAICPWTIAISTVISAFNSLTLSPALSALLLKPRGAAPDRLQRLVNFALDGSFGLQSRLRARLGRLSARHRPHRAHQRHRAGALWAPDRIGLDGVRQPRPRLRASSGQANNLVAFAQLPDAATLDRSEDVIMRMGEIALKQPGVSMPVAFPGLSINGFTNSPNSGIVFATLKPFAERTAPGESGRRDCRGAQPEVRSDSGRLHRDFPAHRP